MLSFLFDHSESVQISLLNAHVIFQVLQSTIYEVDLDCILQSVHIYLQELGMEEIWRRAGADNKPLRMVKIVLHELVKLRGTAIKGHLSMVPIDAEPQPIILAYIDLNLQTLAAARMLTPSGPMGQTHSGDAASNTPNPSVHSTDAQLKVTPIPFSFYQCRACG